MGKVFLTLRKKLGITEEPSITEFQVSNSYPELLRIDAEPIQFEWNIFQGRASSEMLQKVQEYLQSRRLEPAGFRDRLIFMTMFNDIDWTKEGNSEMCISNSINIKNFAERISQGHWTFFEPEDEKKCYRPLSYKLDGQWDSVPSSVVQRFAETGHPIFKGTSALSRGILKMKQAQYLQSSVRLV